MEDLTIAFDDSELRDWLIDLIEDGSQEFLRALAEAVLTADAEDYVVIRPVLIDLKRKHSHGPRKRAPSRGFITGPGMPPEPRSTRRQTQ